jgi:hypothetical protein
MVLDNWQALAGVIFLTNQIEERNGILWQSTKFGRLNATYPAAMPISK